jgi:aspartate/methionine/tyrosine aminotransferase
MRLNENLTRITESFTINLADRVRQLQAQGVRVIGLQTGDPDFNTPKPIMDAAYAAMLAGKTHYANSRGVPELRAALADYNAARTGRRFDPNTEIIISHGGTHAYHCALAAILNPGEEILVPAASWQTHANMVRVLRGVPVQVPALPENDFYPTMAAWEQHITPRSKALVINTPNNPTGAVASRDYLQALLELAKRHNLYLISDEVYDHLLYDDVTFTSCASLAGGEGHVIIVNSFSKTYAMTGWRIGYLCAPADVISSALKESQHTITNVAEFVQLGALTGVTSPDVQAAVQAMVAAYAQRRRLVLQTYDELRPRRLRVIPPMGAFYFFLDVRELGMPSREVAERLLNEVRVASVPGLAYGESGEGFLRITIAADVEQVLEGFRAIVGWVESQP